MRPDICIPVSTTLGMGSLPGIPLDRYGDLLVRRDMPHDIDHVAAIPRAELEPELPSKLARRERLRSRGRPKIGEVQRGGLRRPNPQDSAYLGDFDRETPPRLLLNRSRGDIEFITLDT